MAKNIRIAIRDNTDTNTIAFFDNQAGIPYKSAELQHFLAGGASILTLKYDGKSVDSIKVGCKLAFKYKENDYFLSIMTVTKKEFEIELVAYSLGLELNNETVSNYTAPRAMVIEEYIALLNGERSLKIGRNEIGSRGMTLHWDGKETLLSRLFSIANSFDAEFGFRVELNKDYSLKRQVIDIYKKGNMGTHREAHPVRVGEDLKAVNFKADITELKTAVRADGKDGLNLIGYQKEIKDSSGRVLYYTNGDGIVYAPQARQQFPSVGKNSSDNWVLEELGVTEYKDRDALWGYLYAEIQKLSTPKITYEVDGAIGVGVGDTQLLIDDEHFRPALYVKARVSELTDDMITGKVVKSTFINFERQYSRVSQDLMTAVNKLIEDREPYVITFEPSSVNRYIFRKPTDTVTVTAQLKKGNKEIDIPEEQYTFSYYNFKNHQAETVNGKEFTAKDEYVTPNDRLELSCSVTVNDNRIENSITFRRIRETKGIKDITHFYTLSDDIEGKDVDIDKNMWYIKAVPPTPEKKYLWTTEKITFSDNTSKIIEPAVIGVRGDDGESYDDTEIKTSLDGVKNNLTQVSEELNTAKNNLLAQAEKQTQDVARIDRIENEATGTKRRIEEVAKSAEGVTEKTASLESGLNGISERLSKMSIKGKNYFLDSVNERSYTMVPQYDTQDLRTKIKPEFWNVERRFQKRAVKMAFDIAFSPALARDVTTNIHFGASPWYNCNNITFKGNTTEWQHFEVFFDLSESTRDYKAVDIFIRLLKRDAPAGTVVRMKNFYLWCPLDFSEFQPEEIEQSIAEYKQATDENMARLQNTVEGLNGDITQKITEIKQTADGVRADISTLDRTTVKTASLNLDNNGFVTQVGKVVDGQKMATMIAQDAENVDILAKKLKISGDMIVSGAITADKLAIKDLSALSSNIGEITGGSLTLKNYIGDSTEKDIWGTYHKDGYYAYSKFDKKSILIVGEAFRTEKDKTKALTIPQVALKDGLVNFALVHYDKEKGFLSDKLDEQLKIEYANLELTVDSNENRRFQIKGKSYYKKFYIDLVADNYTYWKSTGVGKCEYMIRDRFVTVYYDISPNSDGNFGIGKIPAECAKRQQMHTAQAWSMTTADDRKLQINTDGGMFILNARRNQRYCGSFTIAY